MKDGPDWLKRMAHIFQTNDLFCCVLVYKGKNNNMCYGILLLATRSWGGGVLRTQSDGADLMGTKIKTQKNPWGLKRDPKYP